MRIAHFVFTVGLPLLVIPGIASAQTAPDAGSLLREAERQQRALPKPGVQAAPQKPAAPTADAVRVNVKAFKLTGNTLIAEPGLQTVLAPWVGKESSFAELQQAANAIAEAYRKRGWLARPQLPAQDVSSGIITINILEGTLGEVRIDDGGKILRVERDLITNTMTARQKRGDSLSLDDLERSSSILNDTPGVAVATILTAGKKAGESDAVVKVQDKPLLAGTAQIDNTGSRSTGENKLTVGMSLDNPSGNGDQISLNANGSDGSTYYKLAYSMPAGRDGLRLGVNASALDYKLVGTDFEALKSKGDAQTYGLTASYPMLRSGARNIAVSGAIDRKDYDNEANAVTTSRKEINSGLIALTGDMLDGLGNGGMTLWGVNFTMGELDLGANRANQTTDRTGPRTEGSYNKWGANLGRLQRLVDKSTLWASVNAQWASKNLDSAEKMSLGGPSGVRAYPVSEATGDEGWLATLEGRYNLTPELQIAAFYDHGRIRRDHDANYTGALLPKAGSLKGGGFSLNWTQPGTYTLRATWARRLGDNPFRTLATGKDTDGSYDKNRLWLTLTVPFDFAGPKAASGAAQVTAPAPATQTAVAQARIAVPATAPAVVAASTIAAVAPKPAPAQVAASVPASVALPTIAKAAPVPLPAPAAPNLTPVRATLESWRQAWADRNVTAYLAHYAPDFRPAAPVKSRTAWVAQRTRRLTEARGVTVELVEPQISLQGPDATQATAVFTQRYQSKQHADVVRKTLTLQRYGDAWRIVSETQVALP